MAKLVDRGIERILKGGKHAALNVLSNWEERVPQLVSKGVRWLSVRVIAFLTRGARQYTELPKRHAP